MSRVIWKATLNRSTEKVVLSGCERILDVQVQHGAPVVWYIHDDALAENNLHGEAVMIFTGHEVDLVKASSYRKTLSLPAGIVAHIFASEAPI